MKSLKAGSFLALGIATLILSGCSSAQKGAAGGGLVGGIGGAVVGNNYISSVGPATSAVVGGAGGAAVGGIAGDAYDRVTESDVERELENLRAELLNKDNAIAQLKESGLDPDRLAQLEESKARLETVEAELAEARAAAIAAYNEKNQAAAAVTTELSAKELEAAELREQLAQAQATKALIQENQERAEMEAVALRDAIAEREATLEALRTQVAAKEANMVELEDRVQVLQASLMGKEEEMAGLERELSDMNVKLEQTSRGITLTIAESLLYPTGRAELKNEGKKLVSDVARILNERFPDREFLIEGHTDNEPIRRSGWKSNWELGAARALSMVHELTANHGVSPTRISAVSYGEFRPAATNATPEGRKLNRRAVIVVLPKEVQLNRQNLANAN